VRPCAVMECPVCHAPLEDSPKFCNICGAKVEGVGNSATAMAPATVADPRADTFVGQTVGGRYKITKLLGEGGMGAVYVGEQNIGGTVRKVAIKTLHSHLSKDPKILQRFERECATVAELQHPNTIQLYDFGKTDEGILYMVMEFVQGESLAAVLEKKGALEPVRAEHILHQICDALGEAHSMGIIHRDLKPDNIVLTERAKDWVKVLDFGIAKRSEAPDKEEAKLTQQGTVLGTPPYMSPEQFTGKPIDARSDIYSIAVIGYEMLAGRLPFTAATPWEWATQHMTVAPVPLSVTPSGTPIPAQMVTAIMRALSKDPNERYATTNELYEALAISGTAAMSQVGGPPPSAIDQKGKTQLGTPASSPEFVAAGPVAGAPPYAPAGGPPYGTGPGVPGGPGFAPIGTPAAGNLAFPAGAPPRKGRGGGGIVIALLLVVGVAGAGGVYYAMNHRPKPIADTTPATTTGADAGAATTATGDAAAGSASSASPPPRDSAPLIDPSMPPLIDTTTPQTHLRGVKPDAGPPRTNPSAVPSATPPFDPPACKRAREIEAEHARGLTAMKKACLAAGGHM